MRRSAGRPGGWGRRHGLATAGALLLVLGGACARESGPFRLVQVAADPQGGGDATLSPDGRRFVTTSRRSGNWDLWAFDLTTGEWTRLTDDPADDFEARWSPDGESLVFTSTRGGQKDVWLMKLADRSTVRLTDSGDEDEYPAFSPDGTSIVYTGGPWTGRDFFVISPGGGEPRRVTLESGQAGACTFEPGGDSLICHRYDLGSGDVVRQWLNGDSAPLTAGPAWDYKPATSADGRWVAFSRAEEGPSYIAVMPAAGGRARPLTSSPFEDRWPTWSASGDTLLFHRMVDGGTAVELLDRQSGAVRSLVGAAEHPLQAALDARGERLVYCAQLGGRRVLRRLEVAGGPPVTIDTGPGEACYPRFSPDGELLAFASRRPAGRWEISVARLDGSGRVDLTAGVPGLRGMDGPVDFSSDGSRVLFHADTTPFAADLLTVEVAGGKLQRLTEDSWFDEAPAFSPDGRQVLFMSTRGGDWTWGLFRLSLADGAIETLAGPDWVEKNYPRAAPDGAVVWTVTDEEGVERLAERTADGVVRTIAAAGVGARWPSYSRDGRLLVYTRVEHRVEYWLAENVFGSGSPLAGPAAAVATPPPAPPPGTARRATPASAVLARSPVDLHRR